LTTAPAIPAVSVYLRSLLLAIPPYRDHLGDRPERRVEPMIHGGPEIGDLGHHAGESAIHLPEPGIEQARDVLHVAVDDLDLGLEGLHLALQGGHALLQVGGSHSPGAGRRGLLRLLPTLSTNASRVSFLR
jgi:hypothetical protein